MTRIIYPYAWQNVGENPQLSYTLLCKADPEPWKLNIPLPSDIYRTVKDVILGMTKGLHKSIERHLFEEWQDHYESGGKRVFLHLRESKRLLLVEVSSRLVCDSTQDIGVPLGVLKRSVQRSAVPNRTDDDQSVLLAVHATTPFLKTTAKKVGKRMLDTGLKTGMQLVQDVINGQPLKKAAKPRAQADGKKLLTGVIDDITQ